MAIQLIADRPAVAQIKPLSNVLADAERLKGLRQQNAMTDMEMADRQSAAQSEAKLNALFQQSGGDMSKMREGVTDYRTATMLDKQIGEQSKLQGQADKARLQAGLEKLNYGSQLLQGATPENWPQIRQEFSQMTGQDLGEQFDPNKVSALMQQGLAMKDKLANEWKAKGYELDVAKFGEQQRHNSASEGIGYMNAQTRAAGGGSEGQKAPAHYRWAADGNLEPIPGGAADIKMQAQQQKAEAGKMKAQAAFENADAGASQTLALVDKIANHKGKSGAVGLSSVANIAAIPGSERQDFLTKLEQLKGQQFLQAFESLKGGGAITEIEGKKAESAIANMNTAQSEEQFDEDLSDFRAIVAGGQERLKKRGALYHADGAGSSLSGADAQAAEWANANPNDPRAAAIRQRLGL